MGLSYTTNRGLFSDHYLATRLPELAEWEGDYGPLRTRLSALLSEKADALPTLSEAQTEQQFIRPVLNAFGWSYETQVKFRALGRDYRPDYALFLSDEQQRAARSTVSSREEPCGRPYLEKVVALAEAKYWERPLEERRADDARDRPPDRGRSPHFQIIDYLRDSGVRWGILTNGRTWRLYLTGTETSEILYYEANLGGILESGDSDEFKRFCLFFRAEAFAPDEQGRCFLDRLRQESQQYATQVEDSLKERVFESVVPAIAEGFLGYLREQKGIEVGPDDRGTLDRIYGGTLLLLYRLFFLLYAEARDLVAVGDGAGYRARSLGHLKEEIFRAVRDGVALGTTSTDWWDDLRNLFRIINRGDAGLNVPRYNGGLFAPDGFGDLDMQPAAEFLEENAIADRHLAEAINLLTRHAEPEDDYSRAEFIDFRDLGVRHLGSVYEGLLEFRLNIADTHLVKASVKGKPVWKPADDPTKADKKPGDLYLTNDKRERKATGSYYTPDYIVRYIVENTVGPQIDRIEREHELAREIGRPKRKRRPWHEILDEVLEGKPEGQARAARGLWEGVKSDGGRREFLLNELDGVQPEHRYDPPTRVLELKVLDPALGSGHFLVGALDYMTTRLAAMLNEYADSPVFERIRDDRRKIVESLKKQAIEADEQKLTDENLLRRMIMKRCLYGVDLNPLAVELSKLSLWLHAFTAGAPLSFLDHHVKCGNSLIGSKLEDLRREVRKAGGLWSLPLGPLERAVQHMLTVSELSDASFEDVERSREEYWHADRRVEGYRAMLDSLTAIHFGLREAINVVEFGHDIDLERYRESLAGMDEDWREILEKARRIARDRRFFHWEVEFPEVFFERRGQGVEEKRDAGFHAVVGNPPYGSKQILHEEAKKWLRSKSISFGSSDIAEAFVSIAFSVLRPMGHWGFIVPKPLTYITSWSSIREFLAGKDIIAVADVRRAFPDVLLEQAVICARNSVPSRFVSVAALVNGVVALQGDVQQAYLTVRLFPLYLFGATKRIAEKLEAGSQRLADRWCVWAGIGGVTRRIRCAPPGKPIIRGASVGRYSFVGEPGYISGEYLTARDCEEHSVERAVCQDIVAHVTTPVPHIVLASTVAGPGVYTHETVVNFTPRDSRTQSCGYLCALLNGRLVAWYTYNVTFNRAIRTMHFRPGYADFTPLPHVNLDEGERARGQAVERLLETWDAGQTPKTMGKVSRASSDILYACLAFLAEQMMEMHKEKQTLCESIRTAFLNCGVDPDHLSSLRVTQSIRDYVARARETSRPTARQRRMRTYAEQAERAFGCSLDDLYENEKNKHSFEDMPRLGFERFKWLAALRGADPALLDEVHPAIEDDLLRLRDVLERIGSDEWYPHRDPETGEYDADGIRSTDWLIDQVVYRLYGL
ncbi:MAG: hypothetical protein KAX44_07200, partial [Candidatus Brocadiae bacterium]|nr:hypothetical protein [Candidatus Brocadiia bacterium]